MRLARRTAAVAGELLVIAGVPAVGFVPWKLWLDDPHQLAVREQAAAGVVRAWAHEERAGAGASGTGAGFAVVTIPRLGRHFALTVGEGTSQTVLDDPRLGMGHYSGTQRPGAIGNFAVAVHRHLVPDILGLRAGDLATVRTSTRVYTYRFTGLAVVPPTDVGVLDPVPGRPGARPTRAIMTITTCTPRFTALNRAVARFLLVSSVAA